MAVEKESGKILVTGGAGYIGSHTCKALSEAGLEPIVVDNLSEGHAEFVKWGVLIEADIRDTSAMIAVMRKHRPDAVVHFAGSAYIGDSVDQPQHYYENNVAGSMSLLRAMQSCEIHKIIFSSTCAVYGEVTQQQLPISSTSETRPINPYGRSKLMVEQMLKDLYHAEGIDSVALRYFNAAGADADCEIGERHIPETHLIPNLISAALRQDAVFELYGDDYATKDGTCIRDYIHVEDLAAAHIAALQYLRKNTGCFNLNLGAGQGSSIREIIQQIESATSSTISPIIRSRRAGDPAALYADISSSCKALGWAPTRSSIENIVESAVNWSRKELDSN